MNNVSTDIFLIEEITLLETIFSELRSDFLISEKYQEEHLNESYTLFHKMKLVLFLLQELDLSESILGPIVLIKFRSTTVYNVLDGFS